MFKNEYQGGPYFEIFSAQGKDPVAHWKLSSPGIKKSFDKEVKSFVFTLEGSAATTKMQLPKDAKQFLCLLQRYLIMQVNIPKGQDFAIDLGVAADSSGSKRRLVLSTTYKETQANPLHAKIPLTALKKSIWLNLCLDLESLVTDTWKGQTYNSVESICISGNCRLRRIFTMKKQAADTTDDDELYGVSGTNDAKIDVIPRQCQLAPDVLQQTQVINVAKVRCCEGRNKGQDSSGVTQSISDLDLSSSGGHKAHQEAYHIAFGTKVAGSSHQKKSSSREGSSTSRQSKTSSIRSRSESEESNNKNTSLSSNQDENVHRDRKNSDPGTNDFDPEVSIDKDSLRSSHTWTDGADNKEAIPFVRPHPPSHPSSGSRRKPRVKSAGKERTIPHKDDGHSGLSSNCSSAGSMRHHSNQQSALATSEEKEKFMKKVQKLASRRSESESDHSSQNTSGVHEADDSISDVINALKSRDQETTTDGDDENTEENSEEENSVYTFSSPPKSAPRSGNNRVKKSYTKGHRTRMRKKSNELPTRKDGAKPETDFVSVETNSSEDESIRSKVFNKQISSSKSKSNGLLSIQPITDTAKSPGTSQTRMSISRKSLREIPKDELRKSGGQKAYNVSKYQMADLSDSFEAHMLLSLKREAMEMNSDEETNVTPRAEGPTKALSKSKLHYDDQDSSDDTSMSTLKSPSSVKQKPHNYQEEMIVLSNTFLGQSNPRDWGNVFSPPIVLPNTEQSTAQVLRDIPVELNKPNRGGSEVTDTDGEEELDLMYDPVLNCYYDPKTCKYYELT